MPPVPCQIAQSLLVPHFEEPTERAPFPPAFLRSTGNLRTGCRAALLVLLLAATVSDPSGARGQSVSQPDPPPNIKPGSIDDVNAIGTRDIGGRGIGNWYSVDSEIRMGRQYAAQ